MTKNRTLTLLFSLIAAHILLAAVYAWITPFRTGGAIGRSWQPDIGAPDERQQVNYVLRLAHGGGFPVFDPKDPSLGETYESHQPPLFYLLETGWGIATGAYMPPPPPASEGREMSQTDGFKLRLLNILIGAATIGGVFMLTLWGYRKTEAALIAAAFAALLPMGLALSGAVSNDPLLICLCTWTLALTIKGVRDGWTIRLAFGVGLLTALAIMTKTTGAALLPVLLIAALLRAGPAAKRLDAKGWVAALAPILVLVVPWWLRNQRLYGDPLALGAFSQAFVGSAQAKGFIDNPDLCPNGAISYWINWVGFWTARSLIGVFGYMDIWLTNTGTRDGANSIYMVVWLLIAAALAGWVLSLRGARTDGSAQVHWLNGIFFAVVLLLFVRFNAQYFQAQGRYLLPAIGPIACGVGLGLAQLGKDRWRLALSAAIMILGFANVFAITHLPGEFQKRVEIGRELPH